MEYASMEGGLTSGKWKKKKNAIRYDGGNMERGMTRSRMKKDRDEKNKRHNFGKDGGTSNERKYRKNLNMWSDYRRGEVERRKMKTEND